MEKIVIFGDLSIFRSKKTLKIYIYINEGVGRRWSGSLVLAEANNHIWGG